MLTEKNKKFLAEKMDEALKLKGLLELIDGYVAKVLINVIDSTVDKKVTVPDFYKEKINALIEAAIEGDAETAEVIAADILDALVDVPGLDDDAEKLLFEGAVKVVVSSILTYLKK